MVHDRPIYIMMYIYLLQPITLSDTNSWGQIDPLGPHRPVHHWRNGSYSGRVSMATVTGEASHELVSHLWCLPPSWKRRPHRSTLCRRIVRFYLLLFYIYPVGNTLIKNYSPKWHLITVVDNSKLVQHRRPEGHLLTAINNYDNEH